jgi:HEAT repeat protein
MLAFVRAPLAETIWRFEFGPSSRPPRELEAFLRWILADYPNRFEEQWRTNFRDAVDVLARWLPLAQSQGDLVTLITMMGLYFDESSADVLLPYAKHPDPVVRAAAARAIGRASMFHTIPDLGVLTLDPDPAVRIQAVVALGLLEHSDGLPLLDAAAAQDPSLAALAQRSRVLIDAGERNDVFTTARLTLASDAFEDATRHALVDLPSPPSLLANKQEDTMVRARAARAMGLGRHRRSSLGLLEVVQDPTEPLPVQLMAIRALGRLGSSNTTRFLLPFLDHPEQELQEAAITAIGTIRDDSKVDTLLGLWDARGGALRPTIADALLRMSDPEMDLAARPEWRFHDPIEVIFVGDDMSLSRRFEHDAVRARLKSQDALARRDAALLLAHFGDGTDVAALEWLYQNEPVEETRWVCAIGIHEMRRRGL